jgi:hypothetical protein
MPARHLDLEFRSLWAPPAGRLRGAPAIRNWLGCLSERSHRIVRRAAIDSNGGVGNDLDLWCSSECTPACQAGGRGFKSRQVRQPVFTGAGEADTRRHGRVAQLAERAPEKREVTGSTPVPTTGCKGLLLGESKPGIAEHSS